MTNYLFPAFVGICLLYIIIFVIPKMVREHKVQVAKEIFLEETPITVVFETDNYTSKMFTLDDMDEIQYLLYKEAQLGKPCSIRLLLEENASFHKE